MVEVVTPNDDEQPPDDAVERTAERVDDATGLRRLTPRRLPVGRPDVRRLVSGVARQSPRVPGRVTAPW